MARENKTCFFMDVNIHKCACGSADLQFVPVPGTSDMFHLGCKACGFVMTGQSVNVKDPAYFRKNWNTVQAERRAEKEAQNGEQ